MMLEGTGDVLLLWYVLYGFDGGGSVLVLPRWVDPGRGNVIHYLLGWIWMGLKFPHIRLHFIQLVPAMKCCHKYRITWYFCSFWKVLEVFVGSLLDGANKVTKWTLLHIGFWKEKWGQACGWTCGWTAEGQCWRGSIRSIKIVFWGAAPVSHPVFIHLLSIKKRVPKIDRIFG